MTLTKAQRILLSSSLSVFLASCGSPNYSQSESHITIEEVDSQQHVKADNIPPLVKTTPSTPAFVGEKHTDTYDVVVVSVPVRDLLFALARDSGINMDIDDNVGGLVTISALDQTLDAILERIKHQVDIRVQYVGDAIVIKLDEPYHKHYTIDFVNISRTFSSSASTAGVGEGVATISNAATNEFWDGLETAIGQILETSQYADPEESAIVATQGGDSTRQGVSSNLVVEAEGGNQFGENASVLNRETGVLLVYASDRIQREVETFLDRVMSIAKRQVLLEATVVEVVLNNQYNQGIDWSVFNSLAKDGLGLYQGAKAGGAAAALQYLTRELDRTFSGQADTRAEAVDAINRIRRQTTADGLSTLREFDFDITEVELEPAVTDDTGKITRAATVRYDYTAEATIDEYNDSATQRDSGGIAPTNNENGFFTAAWRKGDLSAAVQLLDRFGDAKVLSSPRISALNNQPAILRVVDQEVYFTLETDEELNEDTGRVVARETTVTENTVDIGFAMNIFPQISADGEVILNLKPSVTRILDYRTIPTAANIGGGTRTANRVPITRVRELDSVISLQDGEVAVLGGLLEDRTGDNNSSVPGLSSLPGVGALFEKKSESTFKTEFIVFIRARVIKNPSINGDYSDFRHLLPNSDFILRDTESTFFPPQATEISLILRSKGRIFP